MISQATLELWLTDLTLLGLAYWLGRVHAGFNLGQTYAKHLAEMLDEVRSLRHKVDRLNDLYVLAQQQLADRE